MNREISAFCLPRAIGLDLDNTLVQGTDKRYHAPRWRQAIERAIRLTKPGFCALTNEQWKMIEAHSFGQPQVEAVQAIASPLGAEFGVAIKPEVLTAFAAEALQSMKPTGSELTKGFASFLFKVKAAGVRLGVATSSDSAFANWMLRRVGIASFIGSVVGADHPNIEGRYKPGPGPWEELGGALEVGDTDTVLVIEDSSAALLGAMASHSNVFGVLIAAKAETKVAIRQVFAASESNQRILCRPDFHGLAERLVTKAQRRKTNAQSRPCIL
jgi:beta-phosphoglucomutase-like phosphatase (HAD superfamily)